MATASLEHLDLNDAGFLIDPYPTYRSLRQHAPFHWYNDRDMWLVSRHADVDEILRDRRFGRLFVPREPQERFRVWNLVNEHTMLEQEPPIHTRLRKLVSKEFTPRRVERLRWRVEKIATELIAPLGDSGEWDLIAEVAEPLPVAVIAELLGFPLEDRGLLRPWSNDIVRLYELEADEEAEERAIRAAEEFEAYLRALIRERQAAPGDDLLSALACMTLDGDRLSEDELIASSVLLLNAGHEASVNVFGNGVLALLRHPEQLARLRADRGLVTRAVEELIRYDSPLPLFTRTAFADVEVGGHTVREGERVALLLGSANRDETVFDQPDVLNIDRHPNPHVGFGAGIHFCLGAPLARMELRVALEELLRRYSRIELVSDPTVRKTLIFRGYESLRVRVQS